jgi:hypothetical protein
LLVCSFVCLLVCSFARLPVCLLLRVCGGSDRIGGLCCPFRLLVVSWVRRRHVGLLCFVFVCFAFLFVSLVVCAVRPLCGRSSAGGSSSRSSPARVFVCLFVCLFRRALNRPTAPLGAVASRHLGLAACRCDRNDRRGWAQSYTATSALLWTRLGPATANIGRR